ncbi:MAG TPA: 16S rRNA (cytosine(1402)-N(4))-methyltransferase RsmH [Verrucomicrobiae bacterium]|nr:16S rRNA (cytosine(1402)-N(4))-methyltransferase RsmH [Verrucomicrobiae bacterium]
MEFRHLSVMPREVIHYLEPAPGMVMVDGTLGGGGHAEGVLEAISPDGILIGFDRDEEALAAAAKRLQRFGGRLVLVHANFSGIGSELAARGIDGIDGFLADVGVSSHQLDTAERGFSFSREAPLDMRMDVSCGETAADLVNGLELDELTRVIREFGEERWARRIAVRIVEARERQPILTTTELAEVVRRAIPAAMREDRIDPATRTFQALRIAVNDELESLRSGLADALGLLRPGGRAAVISFHSLEDRIVKETFREHAQGCTCPKSVPLCVCGNLPKVKLLTRKPARPADDEIETNPRARSARLRAVEKLP